MRYNQAKTCVLFLIFVPRLLHEQVQEGNYFKKSDIDSLPIVGKFGGVNTTSNLVYRGNWGKNPFLLSIGFFQVMNISVVVMFPF